MDETSFTGFDISKGLKKMLANPKTAYFANHESVYRQHEYKSCQVLGSIEELILWFNPLPPLSIRVA